MMKVFVPVGSQRDTHNRASLIMAPAAVPEARAAQREGGEWKVS